MLRAHTQCCEVLEKLPRFPSALSVLVMVDVTSHKACIYAGFAERKGLAFDDKKGHVSRQQCSLETSCEHIAAGRFWCWGGGWKLSL